MLLSICGSQWTETFPATVAAQAACMFMNLASSAGEETNYHTFSNNYLSRNVVCHTLFPLYSLNKYTFWGIKCAKGLLNYSKHIG